MEKKNFGVALLLWFFLGLFGIHRVYIKENVVTLLWYWFIAITTCGILPIVDLFLLKKWIIEANKEESPRI